MFCLFYKIIIFDLDKEKDDIRSAYCKFPQLGATVNHIAHVIFVLHGAMKTHFVDQSKPVYYPNYFINGDKT